MAQQQEGEYGYNDRKKEHCRNVRRTTRSFDPYEQKAVLIVILRSLKGDVRIYQTASKKPRILKFK
jgi:hypothetical protein